MDICVYCFTCLILGYDRLRKKEIDYILANLDRSENFCELVKLKEKGIVVDQESFISIFQTLAIGFQESDIMEDILEELTKVKTFIEFFF